jgi:hypothetical protein
MRNTIYLQYIPKTGLGFIVAKNDQSALFEKEIPIATGTPPFFFTGDPASLHWSHVS